MKLPAARASLMTLGLLFASQIANAGDQLMPPSPSQLGVKSDFVADAAYKEVSKKFDEVDSTYNKAKNQGKNPEQDWDYKNARMEANQLTNSYIEYMNRMGQK